MVCLSEVDDLGQVSIIDENVAESEVHMDYFVVGQKAQSIGKMRQEC